MRAWIDQVYARARRGLAGLRLLVPAVLVLVAVACDDGRRSSPPASWPTTADGAGGASPTGPSGSPACGKAGAKTGVLSQRVPVFGKPRSYTLVVPPGYQPATSYPLVYVLHGHGGSGAQARRAIDLESAANGRAIFVYPDGHGGGWDLDSPASKNADVALFDATLAITQSNYCIDLHRVFVAGFSNGAYMANQLGCRRGDRIRAVASHAGGGPYETAGEYDDTGHLRCRGKPVASLVVHGAADGTVAPSEGQKSIDHWTHANHCGGSSPTAPAGCVSYQSCTSPVTACKIPGLGHSLWAQAKNVTWSFFENQK
jgi:polyhydroxybutyrate depolymerase